MAILYKSFLTLRTAFCVALLCFCTFAAVPSFAGSSLFTVSDVKVDVKAKNSALARESAFLKAQNDAFVELSNRMLSETGRQNFSMPDSATISTFIRDFEVTKERLSSIRYVGTYTFRFKDKAVRQFFASQGVSYTDVGSRPVLVLPFYEVSGRASIWSRQNDWMHAWKRVNPEQGLVPVVIPIGDLQDVAVFGSDESLSYDREKLKKMLKRYDAGEAVLLIASFEGESSMADLSVKIYRTDSEIPKVIRTITLKAQSNETKIQMLDRATLQVQKALQKSWKNKTIIHAGQGNHLQVRVHFTTLGEWAETQRALKKASGVNEVALKSLSTSEARVDLLFEGNERRLRLALAQAGITLSKPRVDFSQLYDANNSDGFPLVYELYLNRVKYKIDLPKEDIKQPLDISETPLLDQKG